MAEGTHFPLQTIRKVSNIPFKIFGLTTSELSFIIKIMGLSFALGIIFQVILNILMDIPPNVQYYGMILVPIIGYFMKTVNKKYGEGLVFFIVAEYQSGNKQCFKNKTVLESKKL